MVYKKMTYNEKNHSIKTDVEMTYMVDLEGKGIKVPPNTIPHMVKNHTFSDYTKKQQLTIHGL